MKTPAAFQRAAHQRRKKDDFCYRSLNGISILSSIDIKPAPALIQRRVLWIVVACAILLAGLAFWIGFRSRDAGTQGAPPKQAQTVGQQAYVVTAAGPVTNIYAHNLRLHQGSTFRVYIQWLRGQLQPTRIGKAPSFDDSKSFYLNITNGVMKANLGDINNYLNALTTSAPLRGIRLSGKGDQVKITGTLHKVIAIPVELNGVIRPGSNNRIQIHVTKINVLKIPFKAMLGGFHVTLADFMHSGDVKGVDIEGNDIYLDPQALLPPPYIRGSLTSLSMGDPDLEAVYGDVTKDVERVEQWRNFLRLEHGSLAFGKLVMRDVDLLMVDISQDHWFDLDLANYQAQLINGYTRITPEAGLQIFMPDVSELKQPKPGDTSIPWLKNRNLAPPAEVVPKKK